MSFTPIIITGTFIRANGHVQTGVVTALLAEEMRNGSELVEPTVIRGVVDTQGHLKLADGSPFTVFATDDVGTSPEGASYVWQIRLDGAPVRAFGAGVPSVAPGGTIDISDLEEVIFQESDLVALATAFTALNVTLRALVFDNTGLATDAHLQSFAGTNHSDLTALLAKVITAPSTEAKQDAANTSLAALVSANHSDLVALLAKDEAIRALLAGTLLVETRPSTITLGQTNGSGDGLGDVVTYTETLADSTVLNWTDTYNSDGTLHSHVHA